ncbi:MAG: glycosyltransferase family 39 protein [Rhodobacteraceae bacterium]|nr:glycosyltransferase family 39 protein [Paracoccaceae bacterium]
MNADHQTTDRDAARAAAIFWLLFAAVQATKLWLAARLDLHPDEAFYWLEAQYPAISYSDVPVLTPLLVGLGTLLAGDTALGVRLAFLALGALIPLAVYRVARLFGDRAAAWRAATLALAVPLLSIMGLLAVPDVPMILLSIISLGLFTRAVRVPSTGRWVALGLVAALACNAHYRFAFVMLGGLFYLLFSARGRAALALPGPWIAVVLVLLGLLPVLLFNLGNDLAGVRYHFADRHPWTFDAEGLWYLPEQALVVTPVVFAALAWAAWRALARGIAGGGDDALLLWFAAAGVLSFAAMKPWSVGGTAFTVHWPVFGYVPLLILLGLALAGTARWIGAAVIGSGLAIVAALLGFLALSTVYDRLPVSMRGLATAKLSGWDRLATAVEALATQEPDAAATVVTDRVTTLTYVAFGLGRSRGVYTIDDRPLGEVRGRAKQVAIWRLNEAGLRADRAGQDAILVIETRRMADETARLCAIFAQVEPRDRVRRDSDGRSFEILLGRSIRPEPGQGAAAGPPGLCGPA